MSGSSRTGWMPDGRGLPVEVVELIRPPFSGRVHLRLTSPVGRSAVSACERGLGEWWTGIAVEVTCPDCLELVHA